MRGDSTRADAKCGGLDSRRVDLFSAVASVARLDRVRAIDDGAWQTPRPLLEEWDWQYRGSCRRLPPEVFFPEDSGRTGLRAREERAKEICRSCPVLTACRSHALAVRETHGVWGAMSARDRAKFLLTRAENAS